MRLFRRGFQQLQLQRDQFQRTQNVAIGLFVLHQKRLVRAESGAAFVRRRTSRRNAWRDRPDVISIRSSSWRAEVLAMRQGGDIAGQIVELIAGNGHAEILPGDVLDFVRFIEDHGGVVGNDAAALVAFHRQIGEKQVMIDDDDVAFLRASDASA